MQLLAAGLLSAIALLSLPAAGQAISLDEPAAGSQVSGALTFAWTLDVDEADPVVSVYDRFPEAGVKPVWREEAYNDEEEYDKIAGPLLKPGRHWWTVTAENLDGETIRATPQDFHLVPTRLTRLKVGATLGSGTIRIHAETNGFIGVQSRAAVRWRGRQLWSNTGFDIGSGVDRRFDYGYDCRKPHFGVLTYTITVVDSFGKQLSDSGHFREANCGSRPSPGESVFFPSRCTNQGIRPSSVIVACGDGNFQLHRLRWRSWGKASTRSRAIARINNCRPFCFNGTFGNYRASVTLSQRRRCNNGRLQYTRMVYRVAARAPGPSAGTQRFPCADTFG